MSFEIKSEDWGKFFRNLNNSRFEWQTRVELLDSELGDQTLTDGLPLNGITMEARNGETTIGISVGENSDSHHTHSIKNPARIAFLEKSDDHGDVLDIEEVDGTKTLIHFVEPAAVVKGYSSESSVAA